MADNLKGVQIAQSRPSNTNAVSAISPTDGQIIQVTSVFICNTTGSNATCRIFHDEDGTTYDQSTALFYDVTLAANTSLHIDLADTWLRDSTGNLAVRVGTASAITFTFYGIVDEQ